MAIVIKFFFEINLIKLLILLFNSVLVCKLFFAQAVIFLHFVRHTYIEMEKINKNIKPVVTIALLIMVGAVLVFDGSTVANEPDTLSLKVEKPVINSSRTINDRSLQNVQFSDNEKSKETNSSSFSSQKDLSQKPTNQNNDNNMQDSYSGRTIFGSALSIIFKLFQYFL